VVTTATQRRHCATPNQVQSAEPNQKAAPDQQGAPLPPITVNVIAAPKTDAEKEEERKEKQEKADSDRQIVGLTAALARFTEYLFYATAALGAITVVIAIVGVYQVMLARSEFNATHRPHIRIHSVKFHTPEIKREKDLEQVGATVFYANDGDQEAVIESINFSFELRQIPLDSDIVLQGVAVLPKTPIAGGMRGWFQVNDEWDVRTVKLTSDNNSRYFFIGRIVYRAPRGGLREMGFCRHFTWDPRRCRWEIHDNPEYEYSY
jgi:hypothetical protein